MDRLTTGSGRVSDKTVEELRALDLGIEYGGGFEDAFVATFEDFVLIDALLLRGPSMARAVGPLVVAYFAGFMAVIVLDVGLHPVYFNANALYHVVQGIGLAFLFVAFRGALSPAGGASGS